MSQTAKILEMKTLGFSQEHIAKHLGLDNELVNQLIYLNARPTKATGNLQIKTFNTRRKTNDRPAVKPNTAPISPLLEKTGPIHIQDIKEGFFVISAEDLVSFTSLLQEHKTAPLTPDPIQDYMQKEDFQEYFGISDSLLLRYQKNGVLKIYKIGHKQYLKKSQIVEALENGSL